MSTQVTPAAPVAPETATPEAPAAPELNAAPAAPVAPQPSGSEADNDSAIEGLSLNQLLELTNEVGNQPNPDPKRRTAKPEAPAQPNGAPVPSNEPPQPEPVVDDVTSGAKLPKNFRFHTENPQEQTFLRLMRQNPGSNPIELAHLAGYTLPGGSSKPATPEPTEPKVPPAAPVTPPNIAKLEAEIATLQTEISAAEEGFDYAKARKLQDQLTDIKLDLRDAKVEAKAQQEAQQDYNAELGVVIAKATARHPQAMVVGTPQYEEVERERIYLDSTHPGLLDQQGPGYPLFILDRLEARRPDLFPKSAAVKQPGQPPVPPVPPKNAARPVGVALPATSGAPPITAESAAVEIDNLTPEELDRLANAAGTNPHKRG